MMNITRPINTILFFAMVVLISNVLISCNSYEKKDDANMLSVKLSTIETPKGWGYQILVDDKVFIRQENIPAATGNKSFQDKEDALKVGQLAVQKLSAGQMPVITEKELRQMRIKL